MNKLKVILDGAEKAQIRGNFDEAERLANEVLAGLQNARSKGKANRNPEFDAMAAELHTNALLRLAAIKYQRADYNNTLSLAKQALGAERERQLAIERAQAQATEKILHKVLPASVAARLVKGEKVADYFASVSILFADIVGFTPIASKMPARAVLAFLNYVFGEFDRIVACYGCEKIKTIGDGYLAVAGAPIECSDHAERITRVAFEMMNDIHLPEDIRKHLPTGTIFNLRIGIHTGPCFGGVVGENRFVYDIYSDAVNTAARMESHGEAGKIHVSEDFAFHLQNRMDMTGDEFGGVTFIGRDEVEIKGKGRMKTYFLEKNV